MHEVQLSQVNEIMAQDRRYRGVRLFSDGTRFYLVKFSLVPGSSGAPSVVSGVISETMPVRGSDVRQLLNWANEVVCDQ